MKWVAMNQLENPSLKVNPPSNEFSERIPIISTPAAWEYIKHFMWFPSAQPKIYQNIGNSHKERNENKVWASFPS